MAYTENLGLRHYVGFSQIRSQIVTLVISVYRIGIGIQTQYIGLYRIGSKFPYRYTPLIISL